MFGNAKFRWFLLAPIFLAISVGVNSPVASFAGELEDGVDAAFRDDPKEAVRLFRLSAKQGNVKAQYNLGYMYEIGKGVPQDYREAAKWFRVAAKKGLAQAKFKLGWMYANGRGVLQDYVLAHMWISLSGLQGYQDAIDGRNMVEKKMTPQQIEKAQEMARNWKPDPNKAEPTVQATNEEVIHKIPIAKRFGAPNPHAYAFEPKGYPDSRNSISVKYTNIINGMMVDVKWEPIDSYDGSIVGEATIKFKNIKDGSNFSIYNSSFAIAKDRVEGLNLVRVELEDQNKEVEVGRFIFDKKAMDLEYKAPKFKNDSNILKQIYDFDAPFFFYDLDFDNNEELIVVLRGAGQRYSDIFKVYVLKDGRLVDKQEQITDHEPYLQLDGLSTINTKNRTINIHGSSGACNNYDKVYRFKPIPNDRQKGKYILEEYTVRENVRENGFLNCTGFTYKVDQNRKLTLISKKRL